MTWDSSAGGQTSAHWPMAWHRLGISCERSIKVAIAGFTRSTPSIANRPISVCNSPQTILRFSRRYLRSSSPKGSSTNKPPWTKISSYIDKGNQYEERNQLIAAVNAYLKSIALIPTPEAYDKLVKVLKNINMKLNEEHAENYQKIKQNLQENLKGCLQQRKKFP